jgi:hypothetical protein
LLFDLLAGLAFNAERGYRTRFETLDSDLFSTLLTDTIIATAQPPQRILNFESVALTGANTENLVYVRFHRRPIRGIWKIPVFVHVFHSLAGFRAEFLHPLIQEVTKKFAFALGHFRLAYLSLD